MYQLKLYFPGDPYPRAIFVVARAADVLTRIPELLAEHEGCETVVVCINEVHLFAVDCHGNTIP